MKNSTLAIRAVYAAFARVLCAIPASFLNFKGGGGAEMNARTMTISRVCGGILAVFFALSFAAENANAQTAASCERSRVYTPSDDVFTIPTRNLDVNTSGTLTDIVAVLEGFPAFFGEENYFLFGLNPHRINDRSNGISGNPRLPEIVDGSRVARQGDIITIRDLNVTPAFEQIYRVYLNTDSAVALADGQETEILKCEEHLVATRNEFFLDSGWVQTATAASGNSGHDTLTCPTGMVIPADPPTLGDDSACVVGTAPDSIASCAAMNLPFDGTNCGTACTGNTPMLNTVSGMCEAAAATDSIASCAARNLPFDGTNCGTACTGNTPMLNTVSGMCEAAAATDSIASCAARNLPFDGTNCGTACSGNTPMLNTVSGMCEAAAATDSIASCAARNLPFDGTNCGTACTGNTPMLNTVSGMCEVAAATDSIASCAARNLPFDGTNCGAACTGNTPDLNTVSGMCVAEIQDTPETPAAPARTESDVQDNAIVGLGGAAAVGVAAYFLSGGNFGLFAATPDFGYSLTESGYSVNAGGRVDFRKNRWHLYWTAGQQSVNGDFGDFRYSSGGEYKADFWTAAFSEKVSGDVVDYDVSLSANYGEGVWQLSPVYRLHSRFEEEEDGSLESETTNSLNLEGVLRYHRWTVRPSAGFQWREMDDFADNARFGISAVRNL